ncbi:MAG TPA: glycosyltransferase [Hyphomicrobiaceae bacterium]|nr:glycosyltransferase [Hyphomicrobiaceae bacterium]
MVKVVHFIPTLEQGGAERMAAEIAGGDPTGSHVIVTLLAREPFFRVPDNVGVRSLGPRNKLLALLMLPVGIVRALLVLRRLAPQWTVGWLYYGCLFACLGKLVGARVLWSLHGTELEGTGRYWLTRCARRICAALSRTGCTDVVHYCSEASRQTHQQQGFARTKSVVVHNGIDTHLFRPADAAARAVARNRFARDAGDLAVAWIGCVARFEAQKDHVCLLRSLQILKGRGYRFRCLFAGRNCQANEEAFARLIARHGCADVAIALGAIDDVAELYRALDVLVLSSSHGEGMPLVLLEALASGCRVVATDVGSCREIIGTMGIVVPPRDAEALAAAIAETLLAQTTWEWRLRAHALIAENYDKARMLRSWLDITTATDPFRVARRRATVLEASSR